MQMLLHWGVPLRDAERFDTDNLFWNAGLNELIGVSVNCVRMEIL